MGFKKELRPEIEKLSEIISIMEHLMKWIDSLGRIHTQITYDLLFMFLDEAKVLKNYVDRLIYDPLDERTVPAIFATDHPDEDVKQVKGISHIPLRVKEAQQIIAYGQARENNAENMQ